MRRSSPNPGLFLPSPPFFIPSCLCFWPDSSYSSGLHVVRKIYLERKKKEYLAIWKQQEDTDSQQDLEKEILDSLPDDEQDGLPSFAPGSGTSLASLPPFHLSKTNLAPCAQFGLLKFLRRFLTPTATLLPPSIP